MEFSHLIFQKIIGEGVSGNKLLNIEVAQNKGRLGTPRLILKNRSNEKNMQTSMQNEQIHAK